MDVTILAAYRLAGYMTRDLKTAAEAAEDLLGLRMLPDDLAARLSSFRDDCETALEDREPPSGRYTAELAAGVTVQLAGGPAS